jgi:short subunit dehydrogenase-like uncharacterized protein
LWRARCCLGSDSARLAGARIAVTRWQVPEVDAICHFLLYGANGYTGRLILSRALALGMRPLLAGRNAEEIATLAGEHALDHRIFGLDDAAALERTLDVVPVVLHVAGPFSRTALSMVEACIRTRTHYTDITGEISVFERLHAEDARARDAGVMLLPGAGFDVVPTDLLAAHLTRRLPTATHLRLAFHSPGGRISRGTALTMVENMAEGGAVRLDGRITRVPAAWRTRTVDFGFGTQPVSVTTIPWGDVATAYRSTGIPNIEVYTHMTSAQRRLLTASRRLRPMLRTRVIQRMVQGVVRARVRGPGDERRRTAVSLIHGEVEDGAGGRAVARMRAPEGYTLTAMTAVEIVRRVLAGAAPAGFQTPSLAYGADWILELGVERQDET